MFARLCKRLCDGLSCLCALALVIVFAPCQAFAADSAAATTFSEGGILYKVSGDGTVSVGGGSSSSKAVDVNYQGAVDIPATVSHNGTTYTVSEVGDYAFSHCEGLSRVSIPATVTSLGAYAFAYTGTMLVDGSSVNYSGLTTFDIASGSQLSVIKEHCFYNAVALESFVMPASLKSIGAYAFSSTYSFNELKCESGSQLTSINTGAFCQELPANDDIGFSVSSVQAKQSNDDIVYGGLESLVVPSSVTYIGDNCFRNQRSMKTLEFGFDSIARLGNCCFAYCTLLEEVELPNTTDKQYALGQYAFAYCTNLKTCIFNEIAAPSSRWSALRMFDGDEKLDTVIYRDKMELPCTTWIYGYDGTTQEQPKGFNSSNPTLYYTVSFYSTRAAAKEGEGYTAKAVLRDGTRLGTITSALAPSDDKGTVLYEGSIPDLPAGYDAWGFEEGGSNSSLADSVYAFPVVASDVSYGSVVFADGDVLDYTGSPVTLDFTVRSADNETLDSDDYSVSYERKGADGTWAATDDLTSTGDLRVVVNGTGDFTGTLYGEFSIDYAGAGDVFQVDGITYCVIKTLEQGEAPEVMVGDGSNLAIDASTAGVVTIPASVTMPGNEGVTYAVTAIGDKAFGGADAVVDGEWCADVTAVILPDSIEQIGTYAFAYMNSLEQVTIPKKVAAIGARAFCCDYSLKNLSFEGSSIESIGVEAFAMCDSLESICLPAITKGFEGNAFKDCPSLSFVEFKGSVKTAASTQFAGCQSISKVVYDSTMWSYDFGDAVVYCQGGSKATKALYRVVSSAKRTVAYSEWRSSSKKTATVPATVKLGGKSYGVVAVDAKAFAAAKKLKTVKVSSKKITSFANAFSGSKVTTVKVPKAKKKAYKKLLTRAKCGRNVKVKA